jgi:hypothetical protein
MIYKAGIKPKTDKPIKTTVAIKASRRTAKITGTSLSDHFEAINFLLLRFILNDLADKHRTSLKA